MELQKFIDSRKYLYHLTDQVNLKSILNDYTLKSTKELVKASHIEKKTAFLRTRRLNHCPIKINGFDIMIRDQYPLNPVIAMKNMTKGWVFENFVYHLNSRVFFWPTKKDLKSHYKRYENDNEFPMVLRFETKEVVALNKSKPLFCKYNSGAPRCHNSFKKGAAPRGKNSFLPAIDYPDSIGSVREVTYLSSCTLPKNIYISSHPNKPFRKIAHF
jgi:hypothetical protein